MVLGTASHVGKSLVATAFCRLLAERGYRVAPFKAQNMALNSFVTESGGEIGRAQVVQAEAAGVEPHVDMNPILLKPMGGTSQVVLEGEPVGVMTAREYYAAKDRFWPRVASAYDRLADRFDRIVLEGAGSPVEINLAEHDLTNLRMARHADAAIVLVADIERGGVFAQVLGTWELLEPEDRARVIGFIINKFRGDPTLLDGGLDVLRERTGVPVLGVLPYRADVQVDQEDSLGVDATADPEQGDVALAAALDIAVARLPGLSNFTDFRALAQVPAARVRYVDRASAFGRPDLVILPGTRTTVRDLEWLRQTGLVERIEREATDPRGSLILGVCGGFQMLGTRIDDPDGVESAMASVAGLGMLDVSTRFATEKARHRVTGTIKGAATPITGYEIHVGETRLGPGTRPWLALIRDRTGEVIDDGAVSPSGRVFGTYVHGLFDSRPFLDYWIAWLRTCRGRRQLPESHRDANRALVGAQRYEGLATLLREHLDLEPIWRVLDSRGGR
jgi:adenosylcobyric acid synthase